MAGSVVSSWVLILKIHHRSIAFGSNAPRLVGGDTRTLGSFLCMMAFAKVRGVN